MESLNFTFKCHQCFEKLNKDYFIHLSYKRNNGSVGKIFLNPKVGKYDLLVDYNVRFSENESVEFFCPHCGLSLNSERHQDFAKLRMCVDENCEFEIIFSKKFGNKTTLVITEDEEELSGDKLEKFLVSEYNFQTTI